VCGLLVVIEARPELSWVLLALGAGPTAFLLGAFVPVPRLAREATPRAA
jgi:hypothetical protein